MGSYFQVCVHFCTRTKWKILNNKLSNISVIQNHELSYLTGNNE
jgi:hypothetical protein